MNSSTFKTQVKVDLYWKCYAYGDEMKPHIEFLDGIMLSSTRDIVPSCVENVDELIERQEKSLVQLDSKKNIVVDLIAKGKVILEHPDKPKFLEGNVKRIQEGWDDTKKKAQDRLKLLQDTKEAWVGYADNNETIAQQFEVAEEEIKMVKKRYNLEDALSDLKKRQDLYNKSNNTITGLFKSINDNFTCMSITLPEDKKKVLDKEFCTALVNFDNSLKAVDGWKDTATAELKDIKEASGAMLPEDRVARTMDLQEDIAAKIEILKGCAATEAALLPQGTGVDAHAQAFKDELNRITDYVTKLAADTKIECDKYSNDVKFWAEYRTGIKEYSPWLAGAEKAAAEGLSKPSDLNEVKALNEKVTTFDKTCLTYAKVAALKERYNKVKAVSDEWVKKVDVLLKEWTLLDNTVTELNSWVA